MKYGLGALTDKWLDTPPQKKGEPDIVMYIKQTNEPFGAIEVSGSDKVKMPRTLWVRPDKLKAAESEEYPTWFWMVYTNMIRVISQAAVKRHEKEVINTSPYGVKEKYIEIPYAESEEPEALFKWIKGKLEP